jgi:glycosyltransferase involved in cell wall biosynthesis
MSVQLYDPDHQAVPKTAEEVEVSVVMPCLNEARTVGRCVEKALHALESMGVRGEVVVADNGSTDGSQDRARELGARVIQAAPKGYGSALQAGIDAARGRYIIMGDADDSYDFSRLEPFIERLRAGDDLVMGNRFRGGIQPRAMPWHHRYIGNPVLTGLLNLFFHSPIRDAHCGLRGFGKDAYARLGLATPGMEFASEMVVQACLKGQKISEVPTVLRPDGRDRPPHLRSFRDGWRHLRFLLLMCPVWLFRIPSVVMMSLGLGLMALLTPGPFVLGGVRLDVHSMLLGALSVVLGHQTLWLWTFAQFQGAQSGLLPADHWTTRIWRFNLERGLICGGLLVLLGLACNLWLVREWWRQELGDLEVRWTLRYALWGFTLMVMGVQTIFGSFFLGLLRLSADRRTQQGALGPRSPAAPG